MFFRIKALTPFKKMTQQIDINGERLSGVALLICIKMKNMVF